VRESKAGVGGAESPEGAALVWVGEALGSGDGGQPDRHYQFKDFRNGCEEDDDAEGGGGIVRGLAGLVQDYPVGGLQGGGVVSESHQGGEEFEPDSGVDEVDLFPHGVGDPIRPQGRGGGGFGEGEFYLFLGEGVSGGLFL